MQDLNFQSQIVLLADSQLLFSESNFFKRQLSQSDPNLKRLTAGYLGFSNGNLASYFELFVGAMEQIGIDRDACRHLIFEGQTGRRDIEFLMQTDVLLLSGGDSILGWKLLRDLGIDILIQEKVNKHPDALIIGVSAGAIQLGTLVYPEDLTTNSVEMRSGMELVPFVIGVHEESNDWKGLKTVLDSSRRSNLESNTLRGMAIPFGGGLVFRNGAITASLGKQSLELS